MKILKKQVRPRAYRSIPIEDASVRDQIASNVFITNVDRQENGVKVRYEDIEGSSNGSEVYRDGENIPYNVPIDDSIRHRVVPIGDVKVGDHVQPGVFVGAVNTNESGRTEVQLVNRSGGTLGFLDMYSENVLTYGKK